MTTRTNKLIAKYLGHQINQGFAKDQVYLPNGVVHHEELLQYHKNWNYLLTAVKKAISQADNQGPEWENLVSGLLSCDLEHTYNALVEFIESEEEKQPGKKIYYFTITDLWGEIAGGVRASTDEEFSESVNRCVRVYNDMDDVTASLGSITDYVGNRSRNTFTCYKCNNNPVTIEMIIKSTEIY